MPEVLAIVPARAGSKGIPGKNFLVLGGVPLWLRACSTAREAGVEQVVVSSDAPEPAWCPVQWLPRPAALAADDTPMLAAVQHALEAVPGPPEQIILLLQPTQPFRTPAHLREAVRLLQDSGADSVVSVVALPLTHSPEYACFAGDGYLVPWLWEWGFARCDALPRLSDMPARRQDTLPACLRDGTVYAFWRRTLTKHGHIYGRDCRPLIIPPADSCSLDTPEDWADVQRRWAVQPTGRG